MAKRRMFSLDVVDTDAFLEMPCSTQALYFHLGMRADDDGFVSSPKRIINTINASLDDLKLLVTKGFIIPFTTGVCVVKDWKINNYLRADRYTPTRYTNELAQLDEVNREYKLRGGCQPSCMPVGIPSDNNMGDKMDTQYRLGKDNKEKTISADNPQTKTKFIKPSIDEIADYCRERNKGVDAQRFFDYYEANGWKIGKNPMKDWKAAVRTWERNDKSNKAALAYHDPDANMRTI